MSEGVGENPDNKGGQCLGTVGKGQMPERSSRLYSRAFRSPLGAAAAQWRGGGTNSPHGFRQRVGGEEADTECLPPVSRAWP